jgi:hypothetical protein
MLLALRLINSVAWQRVETAETPETVAEIDVILADHTLPHQSSTALELLLTLALFSHCRLDSHEEIAVACGAGAADYL